MANLTRVVNALYCQPWLITPEMHQRLCEIVNRHLDGTAHNVGGCANIEHAENHGPIEAQTVEWWQTWDKWEGVQPNGVSWVGGVAVVDINGVIGRKFSLMLNHSGVTSIDVLDRMMMAALADEKVEALVLDIDSPGGTVAGVPETSKAVAMFAQQKPIVAYCGGTMASAAYWLGCGADAIYAAESADIGSIGVYSAFLDQSRAYEMEGFKVELFKTGKFKGMGMPGLPLTDDQRALIQDDVDEIFDWFKGAVRSNRGSVSDDAMQGQTFFGAEARQRGLIDTIGTLNDAIEYASNQVR